VVADVPVGEGESVVRQVDGRDPKEDAARAAQAVELGILQAEEEALHEEPLPLTRREQVLRYFRELRRRIEDRK
jgi:hypothetical protein